MNKNENKPDCYGSIFCYHCKKYAEQYWRSLNSGFFGAGYKGPLVGSTLNGVNLARCSQCNEYSIWHDKRIQYPDPEDLPPEPLPEEAGPTANKCYTEAASIASRSPRAANAMLRAALESMLKKIFNVKPKSRITLAELIEENKKEFSEENLIAMKKLRITGNEALHPNSIESQDQTPVQDMLWLLKRVSEKLITDRKKVDEICSPSRNEKLQENHTNIIDDENGSRAGPSS